ncbi:MAG: hypothetical protein GY859_31825, partial [Desulfobacterales bacterium]|nr:hypothetical protein [Desulfobacterales bacterium]
MPEHVMDRFPYALNYLEAMKIPLQTGENLLDTGFQSLALGFDMIAGFQNLAMNLTRGSFDLPWAGSRNHLGRVAAVQQQTLKHLSEIQQQFFQAGFEQLRRQNHGELEFIRLFTERQSSQDWVVEYDDTNVMLDLPSLRVIDISRSTRHRLRNYTVVFAPRAGHHSNIAERVALFLRDQGLTRMAVVEQKCADDIPVHVDGKRHFEDFNGQVKQYTRVLAHLKDLTGRPPHLVAVCQPGPLLISTLIQNPHLGKTFGSAGSPMHTEAEKGFLTEFSRNMGEQFIDLLLDLYEHRTPDGRAGAGRKSYHGSLQVLGFYLLGMDQHVKNFKKLLADLKSGDAEAAERQKNFYRWYNTAFHFPAGFIRDTYKKIFVKNELIRGKLSLNGRALGVRDYPADVPIWALGGQNDAIAPPLQATGHMPLIDAVPEKFKLSLI